jgi:hypothetical protein
VVTTASSSHVQFDSKKLSKRGVSTEVQKRNAFFLAGFAGVLVPIDLSFTAVLFAAPLVRHCFNEGGVHQSVEPIDIHGVDPVLKALVFSLMELDRFLVLAAFVSKAGVKRTAHPFRHLMVKAKPPEQLGKLRFELLLPHMLAAAGSRVALAFVGVDHRLLAGFDVSTMRVVRTR